MRVLADLALHRRSYVPGVARLHGIFALHLVYDGHHVGLHERERRPRRRHLAFVRIVDALYPERVPEGAESHGRLAARAFVELLPETRLGNVVIFWKKRKVAVRGGEHGVPVHVHDDLRVDREQVRVVPATVKPRVVVVEPLRDRHGARAGLVRRHDLRIRLYVELERKRAGEVALSRGVKARQHPPLPVVHAYLAQARRRRHCDDALHHVRPRDAHEVERLDLDAASEPDPGVEPVRNAVRAASLRVGKLPRRGHVVADESRRSSGPAQVGRLLDARVRDSRGAAGAFRGRKELGEVVEHRPVDVICDRHHLVDPHEVHVEGAPLAKPLHVEKPAAVEVAIAVDRRLEHDLAVEELVCDPVAHHLLLRPRRLVRERHPLVAV